MIKYSLIVCSAIDNFNTFKQKEENRFLKNFSEFPKIEKITKILLTPDERKKYLTQTEKQKEMLEKAKKRQSK